MTITQFVTDTATLCVFDLASLKHRLSDDCDWWSIPEEELQEVNAGNAAFIGLGVDGKFSVVFVADLSGTTAHEIHLNCPSGKVFVGAGEEVTGDGLEPTCVRGGTFLEINPGRYLLRIHSTAPYEIVLSLTPDVGQTVNCFSEPVRL